MEVLVLTRLFVFLIMFILCCCMVGMELREAFKSKSVKMIIGAVLVALVVASMAELLGAIAFAVFLDCFAIPCGTILRVGIVLFSTLICSVGLAFIPWEKWRSDEDVDSDD